MKDEVVGGVHASLDELCRAAVTALGADGATASVFAAGTPNLVAATDGLSALLEQTQQSLGEGPEFSAFITQVPCVVSDLLGAEVLTRWPAFADAIEDLAVGWYMSLPMSVGGIHLGVFSLYSARAGPVPSPVLTTGLMTADAVALAVLNAEADPSAVEPLAEIGPVLNYRIHQATGMVMAQTGSDAHDALSRMRARAFSGNMLLQHLAEDVVSLKIRFTGDGQEDE